MALVAIWFGTSVASREIIRERAVYTRERMVNLRLLPYVGSKLFVLAIIVSLQCLLLVRLAEVHALHRSAERAGLGHSASHDHADHGHGGNRAGLVHLGDRENFRDGHQHGAVDSDSADPFCGLVGVPENMARVISTVVPATWAYDGIKRFSTLDTLDEEGSDPEGENKGKGLYKHYEELNDDHIAKAREDVEKYKKDAEADSKEYERKMKDYIKDLQSGSSVEPA